MNLLERTYKLIDTTKLTRSEVAEGADVDINWYSKFKRRCIDSPGIDKVQKVHDFLAGKSARQKAQHAN